jgi:hypothetical protein
MYTSTMSIAKAPQTSTLLRLLLPNLSIVMLYHDVATSGRRHLHLRLTVAEASPDADGLIFGMMHPEVYWVANYCRACCIIEDALLKYLDLVARHLRVEEAWVLKPPQGSICYLHNCIDLINYRPV